MKFLLRLIMSGTILFSTLIYAEKFGFKDIYLGDSASDACVKLKKISDEHNGTYPYVDDVNNSRCVLKYKNEDLGIFMIYAGILDIKYASVGYDENNKVTNLYFTYSEFGIEDVDIETATDIFLDNIPWITTLSPAYTNNNELYYEYTDVDRGLYIAIDSSAIYIETKNNKFSF